MKQKLFMLSGAALVFLVAGAQVTTEVPLSIYSGLRDTLHTAKTTVVAVTAPGASASINGENVHVYNTGSFGRELTLNPGANTITVESTLNGKTSKIERKVFYDAKANVKSAKADEDYGTQYFAEPFYVKSKPGAYLQYGNGDDRLGGSKMGFIDADIPLKVIGKAGDLYCVRLASNRIAYVPEEYVVRGGVGSGVVNTGSWSVVNTGKTDRVTVALPARLPYQYSTSIEPQIITVDLFGATDNSNWITQRSATLGIIDFVDFEQVSDDVYRVILRLKDKYQWGYSVHYEGNNLVIDVRHRPESLKLKDLTIGLDAGHGGEFPGAVSPSGIKEKDANLDIVKRVQALLEKKGARVVLTRSDDSGPSMTERKRIWREANVDLAISVHNNSGGGALSSPGTSVFYKHLSNRPFAEIVLNRMLETGLPLFGLVGNFNFSLNSPTEYPNVLVEGMFMSSLEEEEKLGDPAFRQLVAEKIVLAIEDYLKSAK